MYKAALWVFDLDEVLYPNVKPVKEAVSQLMIEYIATARGVSFDYASTLRKSWQHKHRTASTLIAIKREGLNVNDFIAKTYLGVDLADMLTPDPILAEDLALLEGRIVILTNYPREFAEAMLNALKIRQYFQRIYGVKEMHYAQKPDAGAFIPVMGVTGNIVMFDAKINNLVVARKLGFFTVQIGGLLRPHVGINRQLETFHDYFKVAV